ncbi:class I SAM-dependent methyltransferase [Paraburkholderia sp. UCT31]|uniref:class I SAM-dependent methyltransferase n=1 Tax=Paraburkholderia sp. UCT31 TaxID=2615209 RepID=UPI001655725E|nr:class I SAM-dependent methyltransferase [Paraburkholderia sp. UCT31]MBC8738493.1 class I SAM-dependent methyltransferase [Paraburkholderia sp. UCT31]
MHNLEAMSEAARYNGWLAKLIERYAPPDAHTEALDFGAGLGTFTKALTVRFDTVHAVEPCPEYWPALSATSALLHKSVGDVPQASIDYAISLNVLEHIDDDHSALRDIHDTLVGGGRLFLYVPARPEIFSAMDTLVGHVRRYRRAELMSKLRAAGFVVEHARYADVLGYFASWLFKISRAGGALNPVAIRLYDRFAFPLSRFLDSAGASRVVGKNLVVVATKGAL